MEARSAIRKVMAWIVIPIMVALPFSLFACYAALEHNPQGEFCEYVAPGSTVNYTSQGSPCSIRWNEMGMVFGSWLTAQLLVFSIAHAAWIVRRRSGQ
jgi:hypothetical protein